MKERIHCLRKRDYSLKNTRDMVRLLRDRCEKRFSNILLLTKLPISIKENRKQKIWTECFTVSAGYFRSSI